MSERIGQNPYENRPKEPLTPEQALEKMVDKHKQDAVDWFVERENWGAIDVVQGLSCDIPTLLFPLTYGSKNSPQFGTEMFEGFYMHKFSGDLQVRPRGFIDDTTIMPEGGEGFIAPHTVTPEELVQVEYKMGYDGISPIESRTFVDEDFEKEAQEALQKRERRTDFGIIRKPLLPEVDLCLEVIDESHWANGVPIYQERLRGQEREKYKVVRSYAAVPLTGDAEITGEKLIADAQQSYRQNFALRMKQQITNLTSDDPTFFAFPSDETIEPMLNWINTFKNNNGEPVVPNVNLQTIAEDPTYVSENVQLFLLKKVLSILKSNEYPIQIDETDTVESSLIKASSLYEQLQEKRRQKKADARDKRNDELQRSLSQEKIPPLTDEQISSTIDRNIELLRMGILELGQRHDAPTSTILDRNVTVGKIYGYPRSNTQIMELRIFYETSTGKIDFPSTAEVLPGNLSVISTSLDSTRHNDPKPHVTYTLNLYTHAGSPTPEDLERAITGESSEMIDASNRRILPARVLNTHETEHGGSVEKREYKREPWGESAFTPNTQGDKVMWETLVTFNAAFGEKER